MAKLTLDLNNFKASGIYTVEIDASESLTVSSQTLRLVVGFSRKGPFNTPVFIRDPKVARQIFGEIDPILEKKGSFFHRSIETCLATGPVFALNLLSLNNTPTGDKIDYRSYSLDIAQDNSDNSRSLLSSFYNKERFWFADSTYFQAIVNSDVLDQNKLMSFTNLGQRPMSVLIRKANSIKGFDLTARDFYGAGNVPDYVKEFDFISDYFIDVIAIEGDWTDYQTLAIDPVYSVYFNTNGVKTEKIDDFLSDDTVTLIANLTGCIIPDFVDKNGTAQYIETIVNNTTGTTGLFMTMNRDSFDDYENSVYKVDLIGHNLIGTTKDSMNFLSYVSPITDELYYGSYAAVSDELATKEYVAADFNDTTIYVKSVGYSNNASPFFNTVVVPKPRPLFATQEFTLTDYSEIINKLTSNSLIKSYGTDGVTLKNDYVKVHTTNNTGTSLEIVTTNPNKNTTGAGVYGDITITAADELNNTIDVEFGGDSPASLSQYDTVYIHGVNKYYVVDSATAISGTPATCTITLFKDIDTMGTYPEETFYAEWLSEDMQIVESELLNTTVSVCILDDHKDYIANILDSTGTPAIYKLQYVESLSLMKDVTVSGTDYIDVYPGNKLYIEIVNKSIIDGDYLYVDANLSDSNYLSFASVTGNYGLTVKRITQWDDSGLTTPATTLVTMNATNASYTKEGIETDISNPDWLTIATEYGIEDRNTFVAISSATQKIQQNVPLVAGTLNSSKTVFRVAAANATDIEVGQFLVVDDTEDPRLTRVIKKIKVFNASTGYVEYEITVNEPVEITEVSAGSPAIITKYVKRYLPIPAIATNLQFTALSGFEVTASHMPGNDVQLDKILSVLENTNLGTSLADSDLISFRYIVDTFDGGLQPQCGAKTYLTRLAKRRQKCMAIINAPSISKFIESTDPRFTDEPDIELGNPKPILKPEYIASGGNLSLGPSFRFSLPDDANGARFCGVFTPFLKIRENNKTKLVPPAADVSNNFINKFKSGQPYSLVAGPRRGIIGNPKLSGLEYEFLKDDRQYLEPFGLNAIITSKKTPPQIYGNQTAYQKTLTAFNNLHVRDLLITIEEGIEDILSNYVFEFNDANTRLEIRTIVDGYLQNVQSAGGIYEYIVVMDDSNNTREIIDQSIGLIDVGVEPVRGMHKLINRITVLKTGTISSGGFTVA
jgi:hypothetical protein